MLYRSHRRQFNATNTICWTIHRPTRGWYIRIRAPAFPPGVFIPLVPVPQNAPYHADAALSFSARTNMPVLGSILSPLPSQVSVVEDDVESISSASVHSYPPTPTTSTSPTLFKGLPGHGAPTLALPRRGQTSRFILAPLSIVPAQAVGTTSSFFTRALSVLKNHTPAQSNSFSLSRVLPSSPSSPPPPYQASTGETFQSAPTITEAAPLHSPLLTFHETTSLFQFRSASGLLELDRTEEELLGIDASFWIAVALTYLEFLEDREVRC